MINPNRSEVLEELTGNHSPKFVTLELKEPLKADGRFMLMEALKVSPTKRSVERVTLNRKDLIGFFNFLCQRYVNSESVVFCGGLLWKTEISIVTSFREGPSICWIIPPAGYTVLVEQLSSCCWRHLDVDGYCVLCKTEEASERVRIEDMYLGLSPSNRRDRIAVNKAADKLVGPFQRLAIASGVDPVSSVMVTDEMLEPLRAFHDFDLQNLHV